MIGDVAAPLSVHEFDSCLSFVCCGGLSVVRRALARGKRASAQERCVRGPSVGLEPKFETQYRANQGSDAGNWLCI